MTDRCTAVRPLIHDYLEGELLESRSGWVREHLEQCRGCRGHAEAWIEDLQLLLAVEELPPASHWNDLRRKLRWRGPRAASQVSAWLQILCGIAALALVFGAVGFLAWLESSERGDGHQFSYDVAQGELSFQFERGETCKLGAVELAAKIGTPHAKLKRIGSGETWELRVLWGEIALSKGGLELGVARHEERWCLPLSSDAARVELALHAHRGGLDLGPWPQARVLRRDGARTELVATSDERGRCRFAAPLRLEPPLAIEVEIDGSTVALDLPPLDQIVAHTEPLLRFLEVDPARHLLRISVHDAAHSPVVGVRLVVERAGVEGGAKTGAISSELGILEFPLWFAGPYSYRLLDAEEQDLLRAEVAALPASITLGVR